MVALIDDVCRLLDADGLVPVDVALDDDDGCFDGTFFVAPVEEVVLTGTGPKGISRTGVQLVFDGTLWRGSVHVVV